MDELMPRTAEILVVEDNPGDQRLTLEALQETQWAKEPHIVSDGTEAIHFLERRGKYADSPRPDLVLLDLHLPGSGGYGLLAAMKSDPLLKNIPVVIFSTSGETHHVSKSFGLGAECYLRKPGEVDAYFRTIQNLEEFWKSAVRQQKPMARLKKSFSAKQAAFSLFAGKEVRRWRWLLVTLVALAGVLLFWASRMTPQP
jgi:CheY-like chemotaxis protein